MTDIDSRLIVVMCLIDQLDHELHSIGHDQGMSVGPSLTRLDELREDVVLSAKAYGMLDEDVPVAEVRHEATKYDVRIVEDSDD